MQKFIEPTPRLRLEKTRNKIQILLVESDLCRPNPLYSILETSGYTVRQGDAAALLHGLPTPLPDLVVVSPTDPDPTGLDVCAELRKRTLAPIVLLTDTYQVDTAIEAFEVGVDLVIALPFVATEVEARITALLRRACWARQQTSNPLLCIGPVTLNDTLHTVTVDEQRIHLSPTDYQLLRYLMRNAHRSVSKAELFRELRGAQMKATGNVVEVAVRRLRCKIERNPSDPQFLLTQHRVGYKLMKTPPIASVG